jgi:hypothetical protein
MGQEVRLIRYDPQDETWLVQGKDGSWPAVWIKRRCLKPLEAVAAQPAWAFKIGDNVQVGTDETIYTIEQHPTSANDVNITWMDEDGKQSTAYTKEQINRYLTKENPMWRLVTPKPVEAPSFKVGDKVRLIDGKIKSAAQDGWIKSDKLKRGTTYTVARIMEEPTGDVLRVEPEHGARGVYWIRMDSFVPAPVEKPVAPKPVETKKPRLMLCVDMSGSPADYTVGKVYELSNEDDYYYFKRNDQGVGGGGMFKHRFIEIKDEVANSVKVLCINNKGGYEDQLTVGKIYEAQPSTDGPAYWKIPVSDKGTSTAGLKSRFTVLTDETTKREWKVGDKILSSFLNDPNIEKEFHGYDAGWSIYAHRSFMSDRTVEAIAEREGKIGARISGTWDIWITLESLEKHP